jgi:hypothetical protein
MEKPRNNLKKNLGEVVRIDQLIRFPELFLEPLLWLSAADGLAWTGS